MKRSSGIVAPRLDRGEEVAHRHLAEALALLEHRGPWRRRARQREDVGRRLHRQVLVVVEIFDLLLAQPLDVEGGARHEVAEVLLALERAGELAAAAPHDPPRPPVAVSSRTTAVFSGHGQIFGKRERLGALRPQREVDVEHLRDDVAGALHRDRVADADVDRLAVASTRSGAPSRPKPRM